MWKLAAAITVLGIVAYVGLAWAVFRLTPMQLAAAVSLAAVLGAAAFLVRKKHRVDELRWRIPALVRSIEMNHRASGVPQGGDAEALVAFSRYKGTALLTEALDTYQTLNQFAALYGEYKLWARVFRLGREPERL